MTPELSAQVAVWRQKMKDGTFTLDEAKQAVAAIREGRVAAASASEHSRRTRAKKEIKSADEMLNELENL